MANQAFIISFGDEAMFASSVGNMSRAVANAIHFRSVKYGMEMNQTEQIRELRQDIRDGVDLNIINEKLDGCKVKVVSVYRR